ncbi:MAG TPA: tyrosine--tRNA ligase [Acidimicrobiales bacterium]|nr:tyrosine--tRNA ligase [Acidimicrobiales bacterium]
MEGRPAADLMADLEWRGMVHQVTDPELGVKLAAERFVAYAGFDATADSLHVGHLVGVVGLQRLQRAGHRPLALVGGGTTLVGDPSGKEAERPLLSEAEIDANVAGIRRQIERFVELGDRPEDGVLVNNADWLRRLGLTDFLRDVGKHFTVNAMIAKESVRARLAEREQGISYTEFSYMLLQAYDFLHLHDTFGCRLQLGGSDQWGNITTGIELVRRVRGATVYGVTWPLVTKADGTKFGKTEAGAVWLDPARTSPYQFSQFWLRTDDRDVVRYLKLLSSLDREQIAELEREVAERPAQRRAQQALADDLTTAVHGRAAADAARRAAQALFGGELADLDEATLLDVFSEAPSTTLSRQELADGGVPLVDLLARTAVVPSRSAARAAVEAGGAYVNNRRETDLDRRIGEGDLVAGSYVVLRRGKRSYHLVRFG